MAIHPVVTTVQSLKLRGVRVASPEDACIWVYKTIPYECLGLKLYTRIPVGAVRGLSPREQVYSLRVREDHV